MMWLHVKSGLININGVINWFSLSTWYVWLFFWKMHKAAARRKSKGHIKLLNKKCLFLRSYADLVWTHSTVQVFFCECASYPFMQFKLRRMNTPSLASQFFWQILRAVNPLPPSPPVTAAHFWHFIIFNQRCLARLWSLTHNTNLSDKLCVKSRLIWQE